jgi:hypothetical protein
MNLSDWLRNGWLVEHKTSREEISDLLALVERDLGESQAEGLSPDWRLAISYNSALQAATAALVASGYRAARDVYHYRTIQSLAFTIGAKPDLVAQFDAFRKKRNVSGYLRSGSVSSREAKEMFELARSINKAVETWLKKNHPEFLKK